MEVPRVPSACGEFASVVQHIRSREGDAHILVAVVLTAAPHAGFSPCESHSIDRVAIIIALHHILISTGH